MKSITLTKDAQWGGKKRKIGSKHSIGPDLPRQIADKLVARGYAEDTEKCQSKQKPTAQSS